LFKLKKCKKYIILFFENVEIFFKFYFVPKKKHNDGFKDDTSMFSNEDTKEVVPFEKGPTLE
jgi:hypothetical protein